MQAKRPDMHCATQGIAILLVLRSLALTLHSGTTGYPKAVMATTGRMYSRLADQFTRMGIRPLRPDGSGDRWYMCMPICHGKHSERVCI